MEVVDGQKSNKNDLKNLSTTLKKLCAKEENGSRKMDLGQEKGRIYSGKD